MRGVTILLGLALLGACARQPTRTGGIVSTNPCADAILLRLVPAQRIAAISAYSQDPAASSIPLDIARRFPSTAGTAEEVIALNPDLVLTSSFTPQTTRDAYARTIFASEQAEDDAVLDGGGRGVQEKATATRAQQRKAQSEFDAARGTFVNAVQHMGERGYDVHDFAHSYMLAQARVTANDMNHGDVVRVTRGARIVEHYDDTNSVRGESYGSR